MKKGFIEELLSYANWTNDWNAVLTCIWRSSEWNLLSRVCRKKPKMDVASFQTLMKIYCYIGKMDNKPQAADYVENLIYDRILLPRPLTNVDEAVAWNKALRDFAIVSGEVEPDDTERLKQFVFDWWRDMRGRCNGSCDIFKLMKNMGASEKERALWADMFPKEALLKHGYLEQLFLCGEAEYLVEQGKSNVVIDNYGKGFSSPDSDRLSKSYLTKISDSDLKRYLRSNGGNYRIFAVHVDGLRVLAEADCFGIIAQYADAFIKTARNFPQWFSKKYSLQEYCSLLCRALDISEKTLSV